MKDHIRLHHEEQVELECQKCEKKFGNEVHLRAHYQQSHRTQNNSFVCDSCGKSFKLKQSLKMHCLSEHSNVEDQEKYKIQCHHPGCNFASLQKRAVEEHFERIHLKLKKFLCSHCPKSFYNKMRLDEHTNGVHLNKKPFKCELCNFATAYRAYVMSIKRWPMEIKDLIVQCQTVPIGPSIRETCLNMSKVCIRKHE